ncbi:MAG: FAD-dependent monooxygenase [Alphaproteobacteria bacterium]
MTKTKNLTGDLIVCGGGIAGLTFAVLMADLGLDVHLIEPIAPKTSKAPKAPSGRTIALMNSSLNILSAAGIKPQQLEAIGAPLKAMRIIDKSLADQGDQISDFEAADIQLSQFGLNIPNNLLHAALFERAQTLKTLHLHCPAKLFDYTLNGANLTARLEDGTTITAPLLIGADGRRSLVRAIAGIKTKEKPYGQTAMTFILNHSKAHMNIASEFHYPAGPLALVPLQGNQSSVVWVEKTPRAEALIHLKKQDFEAHLRDKTGDALGGITLETGVESWPLCSITAEKLTAPHIALIAEAAHVMSPITAQGLNLSLRDVAALAEIIADGARGGIALHDPALLARYERRRKLDITSRTAGVDGMMRLVSQDIAPIKILRRGGFKALDALPFAKKIAMRAGLSPQIDCGRLAAGQAL